jgi:hypothetical protein
VVRSIRVEVSQGEEAVWLSFNQDKLKRPSGPRLNTGITAVLYINGKDAVQRSKDSMLNTDHEEFLGKPLFAATRVWVYLAQICAAIIHGIVLSD